MVVCTTAAVGTIVASGGALAPVVAPLATGLASGAVGTGSVASGVSTAVAVAGAAGYGASAGALAGAATTASIAGAGTGAVIGGLSGAGVAATTLGSAGTVAAATGGSGAAVAAGTTLGALSGPIGWFLVGTSVNEEDSITYDCWKPVIHEKSTKPSNGMLLRDVMNHPNVSRVTITTGNCPELPHIVLENIWEEKFEIEYYFIKRDNNLVCHAKAI